jgi:hypothetical protein
VYFQVADRGIVNGRVEATFDAWERIWAEWSAFCKTHRVRPRLDGEDFEKVARMAAGFGGKSRCGKRKAGQVGTGMVGAELGGIAAKITMDTGEHPLHQKGGTHYIKPIQLMLAGFSKFDPAVEKSWRRIKTCRDAQWRGQVG